MNKKLFDRILIIVISVFILGGIAYGLNLSRVKTWGTEVLTAADLNAEFDNILSHSITNTDISASAAIALSKIDGIASTDSPTFAGLTITGAIAANGDSITSDGVLTINATSTTSFNDESITNVADIALDSLTSDGATITIGLGDENTYTQTGGTTHAFTLGSASGDDFTIDGTTGFIYEGDANQVGIGVADPLAKLHVEGGSAWTTSGFLKSIMVNESRCTEWSSSGAEQKYGMTSSGGVLYFFTTTAEDNSDAIVTLLNCNSNEILFAPTGIGYQTTYTNGSYIIGHVSHGSASATLYKGNTAIATVFTLSHYYQREDTNLKIGELVSLNDDGKIYRTTNTMDKKAIGIYHGITNHKDSFETVLIESVVTDATKDKRDKKYKDVKKGTNLKVSSGDYSYSVAVAGDSREEHDKTPLLGAYVCIDNGTIENGDYLQSSDRDGYLEKQDDDLMHSYTIAQAREDINKNTKTGYVYLLK